MTIVDSMAETGIDHDWTIHFPDGLAKSAFRTYSINLKLERGPWKHENFEQTSLDEMATFDGGGCRLIMLHRYRENTIRIALRRK